jgi:hypothetical protein
VSLGFFIYIHYWRNLVDAIVLGTIQCRFESSIGNTLSNPNGRDNRLKPCQV